MAGAAITHPTANAAPNNIRATSLGSGILRPNGIVDEFIIRFLPNFQSNDCDQVLALSTPWNISKSMTTDIKSQTVSSSADTKGEHTPDNAGIAETMQKSIEHHHVSTKRDSIVKRNHSGFASVDSVFDEEAPDNCLVTCTVSVTTSTDPTPRIFASKSSCVDKSRQDVTFLRRRTSSFLRVSDLINSISDNVPSMSVAPKLREMKSDITESTCISTGSTSPPPSGFDCFDDGDDDDEETEIANESYHGSCHRDEEVEIGTNLANFHYPSAEPPPGIEKNFGELWVALDDGTNGCHSPLAAATVSALEEFGRSHVCFNEAIWTPADRITDKTCKPQRKDVLGARHTWQTCTFHAGGLIPSDSNNANADKNTVLTWYGQLEHGFYGNDIPLVRASGIIEASPESLLQLLLDSDRVKEYNEMSLGRTDILVLQKNMPKQTTANSRENVFGGITKIWRSNSRPPIVRRTMQFTSLVHARELPDQSGFIIVSRSVNTDMAVDATITDTLNAEILLNINVLKRVEKNSDQCLFISVNHVRSPIMVPNIIAKRVAIQGVTNFIQDLRKCFPPKNNNTKIL